MKRIVFALFEDAEQAEAALREVASDPACVDHFHVVKHPGKLSERELKMYETDARGGSVKGLVIGGLGGAVLAALVGGPLGAASTAVMGGVTGGALGALQGFLAGSSGGDPRLEELAKALEQGQVLLTLDTDELRCERDVEQIFRRRGASECHRHHFV
jgi:hypothetical protein